MDGAKVSFEVKWRKEARAVKYGTVAGCSLVGNRVYCLGDARNCAYYSRSTKKWIKIKGFPWQTLQGPSAIYVDDRIIILGRKQGTQLNWRPDHTEIIEFDIPASAFRVVQTNRGPGQICAPSAVFAEWRREIIVFGGYRRSVFWKTRIAYSFNVDMKAWTKFSQKGQVPISRSDHTATILQRRMYVHGGKTSPGFREVYSTVRFLYIADLSVRYCLTWSTPCYGAESPTIGGYRYPSISAFDGRLLIIGGNTELSERAIFAFHPKQTQPEWSRAVVVNVSKKHIPRVGHEVCFAVPVHNGLLCVTKTSIFTAEISSSLHE